MVGSREAPRATRVAGAQDARQPEQGSGISVRNNNKNNIP